MMNLREIVERYESLTKNFGEPVALAAFGLSPEETTMVFAALDEDYHISRFVTFCALDGKEYAISGNPVTHVKIWEAIRALL